MKLSNSKIAVAVAISLALPFGAMADEGKSAQDGVKAETHEFVRGDGWKNLPRKERVAREWRSLPKGERIAREKAGRRPPELDR
jgi:hypothetical protein